MLEVTVLRMLRRMAMRANSTLDCDCGANADRFLERNSRRWNDCVADWLRGDAELLREHQQGRIQVG